MPLEVTKLNRVFSMTKDNKVIEIGDPNPEFTAEEVMKFYSSLYPELTNGLIEGPKVEGDKAKYSFTTKAGKLG